LEDGRQERWQSNLRPVFDAFNVSGFAMQKFQVNEDEVGWGGFLVDADARAALEFFDRAILANGHYDPDIVEEAWRSNRTIVTSNRRDFVRYVREFQTRENNRECRDLWGLLVIPNLHLLREKGLKAIKHGLSALPNAERLRWPGAAFLNLYVHLTDAQKIEIRRFERCSFCERGIKQDPWKDWYSSLPVIGIRVRHQEATRHAARQ
jgi:hypothetical protein